MSVSVSGVDGALALVNRLLDADGVLAEGISQGAEIAAEAARGMCPVRTGALRSSIKTECSGTHAEISANCSYAGYVEFGTYKMAARPFMVPGLYSSEGAVIAAIESALGGLL